MFLSSHGRDIGYMIDRLCPLGFARSNNTDLSHKCLVIMMLMITLKTILVKCGKFVIYFVQNTKVKLYFLECSLWIVAKIAEYQEELYNIVKKSKSYSKWTSSNWRQVHFLEFNEVQYVNLFGFLTKTFANVTGKHAE